MARGRILGKFSRARLNVFEYPIKIFFLMLPNQQLAMTAGRSITATCRPERLRSALATRPVQTLGSGPAGCHPGEPRSGISPTFEEARADFERAWAVFLSKRTQADFQPWRDQQVLDRRKISPF
jgi:hypothetical protein